MWGETDLSEFELDYFGHFLTIATDITGNVQIIIPTPIIVRILSFSLKNFAIPMAAPMPAPVPELLIFAIPIATCLT